MSTLDYNGQHWFGVVHTEQEVFSVLMPDAVFQKHLNAYLQGLGVSTMSYSQVLAYANQVLEQRCQAGKVLQDLNYWRDCDDPEVHITTIPKRIDP